MGRYDTLFEPVRVGPISIPNRIVRSAHGTLMQGEALIAYHEARARGGVGMSTLEASGVHASAPSILPLHSDAILPFYEAIAPRVHRHGMKLFQQIYHSGAATARDTPWSVSTVPNPMTNIVPVEMTQTMIDDVVAAFGSAARRVRDGGLDGVDIHASSGYLIHEFLSPALNKRRDGYGGSFENRLRLLLEVIAAVRAAVGQDIAIGVRLPNEDYVPGGLTAVANAAIAQAIEPLVDYISLHMGSYWRFHRLIAPSDDPLGVEMPANRIIGQGLTKPRIVVGRIMNLDQAESIVRAGEAELVSMVRALIADPELPNKARRLEESRIRPCIGTNMGCVGQLMTRGVLSCVVNVAAAQESRVSFEPEGRAAAPKRVLVVGGGPAGLEAARTLAMRGHHVTLCEATARLGGQVRLAASAPHRADVGQIVQWLESELEVLGVDVRTNTAVDAAFVREFAPAAVVLASGVTPRDDGLQIAQPAAPIPGGGLPHVHGAWALFGVGRPPSLVGPALVFDDTGTFEAISAADVLLAAGIPVTFVSRFDKLGENLPHPPVTVGAARERLYGSDFEFIGGHYLRSITPEQVEIGVLFTERVRRIPARTVVVAGFNQPNRALADELAESGVPVHLVGDVVGRGDMMSAIHGAARIARALE